MRCVVVSLEHVLAELVRLFVLPAWVSETEKPVDRGLSRFPVKGGEPQQPSRHLVLYTHSTAGFDVRSSFDKTCAM